MNVFRACRLSLMHYLDDKAILNNFIQIAFLPFSLQFVLLYIVT